MAVSNCTTSSFTHLLAAVNLLGIVSRLSVGGPNMNQSVFACDPDEVQAVSDLGLAHACNMGRVISHIAIQNDAVQSLFIENKIIDARRFCKEKYFRIHGDHSPKYHPDTRKEHVQCALSLTPRTLTSSSTHEV